MFLRKHEREKLIRFRGEGRIKIWRWSYLSPMHNVELPLLRTVDGIPFTIISCQAIDRKACQKQTIAVQKYLDEHWKRGHESVWLVEFLRGDWTDEPRYLAPTGRGDGDYTRNAARGMPREPEPLTEHDLDAMLREQ